MTTPTPAEQTPTAPDPKRSRLTRWKDAEPVRLYAYGLLSAVLVALAAVGTLTGELAAALTGVAAAVLAVVPAAEAARASVWSPQTHVQDLVHVSGDGWPQQLRDAA